MQKPIQFVTRNVTPYWAISICAPRQQLAQRVPPALGELMDLLASHGIVPNGSPIIRYRVVDYNTGVVEVDVGVPVPPGADVPNDSKVVAGEIPAGRFATLTHLGPYDSLVTTTAAFLKSAEESGLALQVVEQGGVTRWPARVEHYRVGPADDPSPENWRTEIEILLSTDGS